MTVCPPKATSTKLNTDLEQAKLVSLTNDTRIKLSRSAEEAFSDLMFQRIMKNESIVDEENSREIPLTLGISAGIRRLFTFIKLVLCLAKSARFLPYRSL